VKVDYEYINYIFELVCDTRKAQEKSHPVKEHVRFYDPLFNGQESEREFYDRAAGHLKKVNDLAEQNGQGCWTQAIREELLEFFAGRTLEERKKEAVDLIAIVIRSLEDMRSEDYPYRAEEPLDVVNEGES
jgi:hypothetical protein